MLHCWHNIGLQSVRFFRIRHVFNHSFLICSSKKPGSTSTAKQVYANRKRHRHDSSFKEDASLTGEKSSLSDVLFDDGGSRMHSEMANPSLSSRTHQIYRVQQEVEMDKGEMLLKSIIRTSEETRKRQLSQEDGSCKKQLFKNDNGSLEINHGLEGLTKQLETQCNVSKNSSKARSYSESVYLGEGDKLEPLDMSFERSVGDESRYWLEDEEEDLDESRSNYLDSPSRVNDFNVSDEDAEASDDR